MKMMQLRTMMMGLVVAGVALSLTGCGIPYDLSKTIDLVKDIEVPALPSPEDNAEIPEEFRENLNNLAEFEAALAEEFVEPFEYQMDEEFCDLPNLQSIREEAEKEVPKFLAKRLEVRKALVTAIRFIADSGNFKSLDELVDTLTVNGKSYVFTIVTRDDTSLTLTSEPPLDLADFISNPDLGECIQNSLSIVGMLPKEEILFKVVLDLDITLFLRIL